MENRSEMTFEEAYKKLEEGAEALRSGRLGLEESIEVYDKNIMLYNYCKEILENAKQKIKLIDPETGKEEEFLQ